MRTPRSIIVTTLIAGALAGGSIPAWAQDDESGSPVPFTSTWESERWIEIPTVILLRIEGSSDPRMDGVATVSWNDAEYPGEDGSEGYVLSSSTTRIVNGDGAWQGSAFDFSGDSEVFGGEITTLPTTVLVGEDGYEGLYAVVMEVDGWADVKGVILTSPPPEMPAPVAIPE